MTFLPNPNFEKSICNLLISISDELDEYKKKPDSVRFCLLLDKIKMVLGTASGLSRLNSLRLFVPNLIPEHEISDKTIKALKNITTEIDDLEKFVLGKRETEIKSISDKLDEVLLGPDYPEGNKLMKRARADFEAQSGKVGESGKINS